MISEIVTQLQTTAMAQVLRPDAVGVTTIDCGVLVADLISSEVGGRVYNLQRPQSSTLPDAVFQQVSSKRDEVDGLPIIRTEKIVLTIRASGLTSLETVGNAVRAALLGYASAGNAGAITIEDEAQDVEQVGENTEHYRLHLELNVTHLAAANQSLPAAFVYPLRTEAIAPEYANDPRQIEINEYAIAIVEKSTGGAMDTARSYVDSLIGYQSGTWAVEYSGGELIRQDGHLTTWRERVTHQSFRAIP